MEDRLNWNEERPRSAFWIAGILLAVVAVGDYFTGPEVAFQSLYLIPIALLAWFAPLKISVAAALLSVAVRFSVDVLAECSYSDYLIHTWDFSRRLAVTIALVVLLSSLRKSLERERSLARTDPLTGAMNARVFRETVEHELSRSARYERPITLAFIDVDDFKAINDAHGHRVGDAALRSLSTGLERCTRKTDVVARMGGDEFAILLPETGQEAARKSIEKVRECLKEEMRSRSDVAMTFSIGVATCVDEWPNADELIQAADALMYSVKQHGKDGVSFSATAG